MLREIAAFFLIVVAYSFTADVAVYSTGYPAQASIDQLKCLKLKGYLDQAFIQAKQNSDYSTYTFSANVAQMKAQLGVSPHLIVEPILFESQSYQLKTDAIAKLVKNLPIKMLWTRGNYGYISCVYMQNFVKSLRRKVSVPIGIIASYKEWDNSYESGCLGLQDLPLLYKDLDNKWISFGGWYNYDVKLNLFKTQDICSVANLVKVQSR